MVFEGFTFPWTQEIQCVENVSLFIFCTICLKYFFLDNYLLSSHLTSSIHTYYPELYTLLPVTRILLLLISFVNTHNSLPCINTRSTLFIRFHLCVHPCFSAFSVLFYHILFEIWMFYYETHIIKYFSSSSSSSLH